MGRGQNERLTPCVCSTPRLVSRAATQLYDVLRPSGLRVTLAVDQTTLTRGLGLLERDRLIDRAPHPDGRIKAMRLTPKGRRTLDVARPLWARAQDKVLRELGAKAWTTRNAGGPVCFTSSSASDGTAADDVVCHP